MDIGKTQQNVAAGTRISGRARGSAPRSRVKHVEVLVKIRELALLILGDLDPYPPNLTRRALPPPDVRRASYRDALAEVGEDGGDTEVVACVEVCGEKV